MTGDERLGPPPIEPLSDAAWSRIERGMWSQLDAMGMPGRDATLASARRWWLVAAPLVAAAAVAAIMIGTRTTTLEITDGPSRVVSGAAPSSVSFGDAHIELDANSALVTHHEAGSPVAMLDRGAAWFTVAPRRSRPAFIVRAGDATIRVVGTRFRVARSEERISVAVEHGLVDVQFHGRVAAVGVNQRWSSESPGQIATIADAAPPTQPAPKTAAKSEGKPKGKPGVSPGVKADARLEPRPGAASTGDVAPLDPDRAEYERLAALAGYLALARGTSRWADPALFAAARLAVDSHDHRAETLLRIYLQRFPSGANATDATQLLAHVKGNPRGNP